MTDIEIEIPEGIKTRGVSKISRSGADLVIEYNDSLTQRRHVIRAAMHPRSVAKTLDGFKRKALPLISDRLLIQAIETLISDNEAKLFERAGATENNGTATENPQQVEPEKVIVSALVEDGDSGSLTYVLTESALRGQKVTIKSTDEKRDTIEILSRAPILTKILNIEGEEILEVEYGKNKKKILGDVLKIQAQIQAEGGIGSTKYFRSAVSTVLEAQRRKLTVEYAYPTVGVYVDKDGRFVIALPQYGNVYLLDSNEYQIANEIIEDISKLSLPDDAKTEESLAAYIGVPGFYRKTDGIKEDHAIRVLGFGVVQPFAYELKALEAGDYFPQYLSNGGRGLGKSTLHNLVTEDLFGINAAGPETINSPFRLLQMFNATTMPQHIAEIEKFDFNEHAGAIKTGTELRRQGYRGNGDQSVNRYKPRSTFMPSSNSYKANKEALLARVFIDNVSGDAKTVQARHRVFFKEIRSKTHKCLLGYRILESIIAEYTTPQLLIEELHKLRSELELKATEEKTAVNFTDQRRVLGYAMMLFGLRSWAKFAHRVIPKTVYKPELWFNKYSDITAFLVDIVRPLEVQAVKVLQQIPIEVFRSWLVSYIATEGLKAEGDTWMRLKTEDAVYVAGGVLQAYKEHAKRAGEAPYESLEALAMDLTTFTGKKVNVYPVQFYLEEERDSDDRIIKHPKPKRSGSRAVKVPLDLQGSLEVHLEKPEVKKD